jgi:hypothetical protein
MDRVGANHTKTKKPSALAEGFHVYLLARDHTARVTFPERRQRVQVYTRLGEPSTIAFTRRMLAFQQRLERLWEWDTRIPKVTALPQYSHFAIVLHLLLSRRPSGRTKHSLCEDIVSPQSNGNSLADIAEKIKSFLQGLQNFLFFVRLLPKHLYFSFLFGKIL